MQQSLKSPVPCRKDTCVLSHVVRPVEACRVKVGWAVLRVRRSPHQLYLDGGAARGARESHVQGALLASLEAGWCIITSLIPACEGAARKAGEGRTTCPISCC